MREWPSGKVGTDMTYLDEDLHELNINDLDAVSGGNAIQDAVAQIAKTAAQIITGNVGKCTQNWYTD
jgi:hypothetical protein